MTEAVGVRNQEILAEFVTRLTRLNYAHSTCGDYRRCIRRFLRAYPDVPIDAITAEHLERYLDGLLVSPRTYGTELERIRAFFKWAVRQKRLLRTNPADGVERPRYVPRYRPAITREEFEAVCHVCATLEERVLTEVLYFTGLRIAELRAVRIRDIDLRRRRIHVVHGKADRERIVVFPERVGQLLRQFAWETTALHPDARLLRPQRRGYQSRSLKWVQRTLVRLGLEANLRYRLTAHVLRHGFFRLMKVRGVPIEVAARLGGHSSIKTTVQVYGRLDEDDLQAAYDRHVLA